MWTITKRQIVKCCKVLQQYDSELLPATTAWEKNADDFIRNNVYKDDFFLVARDWGCDVHYNRDTNKWVEKTGIFKRK